MGHPAGSAFFELVLLRRGSLFQHLAGRQCQRRPRGHRRHPPGGPRGGASGRQPSAGLRPCVWAPALSAAGTPGPAPWRSPLPHTCSPGQPPAPAARAALMPGPASQPLGISAGTTPPPLPKETRGQRFRTSQLLPFLTVCCAQGRTAQWGGLACGVAAPKCGYRGSAGQGRRTERAPVMLLVLWVSSVRPIQWAGSQ